MCRSSVPSGIRVESNGGIVLKNQEKRVVLEGKAMVIEREYGQYKVKICFAGQADPEVPRNVMDAITQAFRRRIDKASEVVGTH